MCFHQVIAAMQEGKPAVEVPRWGLLDGWFVTESEADGIEGVKTPLGTEPKKGGARQTMRFLRVKL